MGCIRMRLCTVRCAAALQTAGPPQVVGRRRQRRWWWPRAAPAHLTPIRPEPARQHPAACGPPRACSRPGAAEPVAEPRGAQLLLL